LGICIYKTLLPHWADDYIGFTSSCPPTFYNKIAPMEPARMLAIWENHKTLVWSKIAFVTNFRGHSQNTNVIGQRTWVSQLGATSENVKWLQCRSIYCAVHKVKTNQRCVASSMCCL